MNQNRNRRIDNSIKGVYTRKATNLKLEILLIKSICWSPRNDRPELVSGDPFTIYWN